MLEISRGTGFKMTFQNGITLSVQFGAGNYCDNRDNSELWQMMHSGAKVPPIFQSKNAEIAVLRPDGKLDPILLAQVLGEEPPEVDEDGYISRDSVEGWVDADTIGEVIARIIALE